MLKTLILVLRGNRGNLSQLELYLKEIKSWLDEKSEVGFIP